MSRWLADTSATVSPKGGCGRRLPAAAARLMRAVMPPRFILYNYYLGDWEAVYPSYFCLYYIIFTLSPLQQSPYLSYRIEGSNQNQNQNQNLELVPLLLTTIYRAVHPQRRSAAPGTISRGAKPLQSTRIWCQRRVVSSTCYTSNLAS